MVRIDRKTGTLLEDIIHRDEVQPLPEQFVTAIFKGIVGLGGEAQHDFGVIRSLRAVWLRPTKHPMLAPIQ